jgi:CO/xanthine dehydrogenase Mo-binding subunit
MTTEFKVIGKPVRRVEGPEKVTGRAKYAADNILPGALWGKCLHSPHAYARILSIDTSAAEALPGVHAVITGKDTRDGGEFGLWGRGVKDAPVLAYDVVRFSGERVAAVAADDEDIAQAAVDLIEVEYEILDPVLDPIEALKPGAPILHPDFNSYYGFRYKQDHPENVHLRTHYERGNIDEGFAEADIIVENTYVTSRQSQATIEPQSILVNFDETDRRVHVWHCNKVPHYVRGALAYVAGIPEEQLVLHPSYIGGDFGMKGNSRLTGIGYYLAKATRQPVRMIADYIVDEFLGGNPRHHVIVELKTGIKRDGTITAHRVNHIVNTGAYAAFKSYGSISGANQAAGVYKVPNVLVDSTFVYTNTLPGGFMRAPGEPQGIWAIESHIDECAHKIGMDPAEFRRKTLIEEGDESGWGEEFEHLRVRETMEAALDASGYFEPKAPYVGRGIGIGERGQSGGMGTVDIVLHPDGTATVGTPVFDQGTGVYTVLVQVVAEELDVSVENVKVDIWNTDEVDSDAGMAGSHSTRIQTVVGVEAANEVKRDLVGIAALHLEWPEDVITVNGGRLSRTDTDESVSWQDLLQRAQSEAHGRASFNDNKRAEITGFVAQVAEVEIDPDTGNLTLRRFTTAHDAGTVVNPVGFHGQINGGVAHGIGYALTEDVQLEDGRVTTLTFGDDKIPTVADMPPLTTVVLPSEHGVGPYRIRGIGEASCIPVAPAIANAVEDAIGVRIRDLPITAEKIYRALQERDGASR